jgi:UPF0755 protein
MKWAFWTFATTVILVGVTAVAAGMALYHYPDRPHVGGSAEVRVDVRRGMSLPEIVLLLQRQGIVSHPALFRLYVNHRGLAGSIKAGQHTLRGDLTPRQVLDQLVQGAKDVEVTVTIPEGRTILDVADLCDQAGVAFRDELLALMRSPRFVREHGITGATLEGYLFPDTYRFRPRTPATRVLATMLGRQKQVFEELRLAHRRGVEQLKKTYGFTSADIVTLASIVEREAKLPEERPRVAAVFLNRLRLPSFQPKLLQTDPSILYGCTVPLERSAACRKLEERIRRIQLDDRDNPYNTYVHPGLPPGPIGNPGRASLEAVLNPEKGGYLFFVARNDGSHQFSRTQAEHERAVNQYQR